MAPCHASAVSLPTGGPEQHFTLCQHNTCEASNAATALQLTSHVLVCHSWSRDERRTARRGCLLTAWGGLQGLPAALPRLLALRLLGWARLHRAGRTPLAPPRKLPRRLRLRLLPQCPPPAERAMAATALTWEQQAGIRCSGVSEALRPRQLWSCTAGRGAPHSSGESHEGAAPLSGELACGR